jgi:dethiobiotin synthetase
VSVFVTGTDTGVGKTYFSTRLVRSLRAAGMDAVGFKPLACGSWDDVDALVAAAGGCEPRDAVCPMKFDLPASPLTAARADRLEIDPEILLAGYRAIAARHEVVVVEGVGGWLVPITPRYAVADLAVAMDLPVIVVAQNRLGAINHTLLTVENVARRGLFCGGIVLNHLIAADDDAMRTNREILSLLPTAPVLCELKPGAETIERERFAFAWSPRVAGSGPATSDPAANETIGAFPPSHS